MKSISFENIAELFNDGIRQTADNKGLISQVQNTLFEMPLKNSLVMTRGPDRGEYTRIGTGTIVDRYGILRYFSENEPRFNENGMLFEDTRTNAIPYSNDFSQWNGGLKTYNFGISPDGSQNSTRITFPGPSTVCGISDASIAGLKNSGQIWVKGIKNQTILYQFGAGDRLHTLTGSWDLIKWENYITIRTDFNISTYGSATARVIEVFGAQCEQGETCSSYIPTNGVPATRGKDILKIHSENILQMNSNRTIALDYIPLSTDFSMTREILNFSNTTQMRINTDNDYIFYASDTPMLIDEISGKGIMDRLVYTLSATEFNGYFKGDLVNMKPFSSSTVKVTSIDIGHKPGFSAWGYISNIRFYDSPLGKTALMVL